MKYEVLNKVTLNFVPSLQHLEKDRPVALAILRGSDITLAQTMYLIKTYSDSSGVFHHHHRRTTPANTAKPARNIYISSLPNK